VGLDLFVLLAFAAAMVTLALIWFRRE